jgi:hypothetical protein
LPIGLCLLNAFTARRHEIPQNEVRTNAGTAVSGRSNSWLIGSMTSRNTVKSNASSVPPSQAAI